jgi:hypothetical protein
METLDGIERTDDGRLVLRGAATLPPMESEPPGLQQRTPRKNGTRTTRDRFDVLNAFVDGSLAGLSRVQLATWLVLYRDTRNGTACTSQSDIARRAGCSVRGVQKAIAKLLRVGLVVRLRQGRLNGGASVYRVEPMADRRRIATGYKANRGS